MKRLLVLLLAVAPVFAGDMRVKTVQRTGATGLLPAFPVRPETTLYVHETVQREEFVGYVDDFQGPKGPAPHMAIITHCDTGVSYQIDLDHQEYREVKIPKYPTREQFDKQVTQARKEEEKHAKSSTADTGETKDFYGHIAKHLVTKVVKTSKYSDSESTTDGWYLDLPQPGCAPEYLRWNRGHEASAGKYVLMVPISGNHRTELLLADPRQLPGYSPPGFTYTGFEPSGFAIQLKSVLNHTLKLDNGDRQSTETILAREVVEFSEAPLDPALFEVPAGFKKVGKLYQHMKESKH